jgi:hypothetical protein
MLSHDHSHGEGHGVKTAAPGVSLFGASVGQRLLGAALVAMLLWSIVYWALV